MEKKWRPQGQKRLQKERDQRNEDGRRQTEPVDLNLLLRCVGDGHAIAVCPLMAVVAGEACAGDACGGDVCDAPDFAVPDFEVSGCAAAGAVVTGFGAGGVACAAEPALVLSPVSPLPVAPELAGRAACDSRALRRRCGWLAALPGCPVWPQPGG